MSNRHIWFPMDLDTQLAGHFDPVKMEALASAAIRASSAVQNAFLPSATPDEFLVSLEKKRAHRDACAALDEYRAETIASYRRANEGKEKP